ncbi:MAG TPA: hypothetical protein RMG48_00520 [Myxococcales bacterium LLY-WYZ-16_1]|nr:hypothetical protein [Myxococcales bacterium LLY-WYZ-16_1]
MGNRVNIKYHGNNAANEMRKFDTRGRDDKVRVSKVNDELYKLTVNGQVFELSRDDLEGLEIDLGGGDDHIIVDEDVDVDFTVKGGGGQDTFDIYADDIAVRDNKKSTVNYHGDNGDIDVGKKSNVNYTGDNGNIEVGKKSSVNYTGDNGTIDAKKKSNIIYDGNGGAIHTKKKSQVDVTGHDNSVNTRKKSNVTVTGDNNTVRTGKKSSVSTHGYQNSVDAGRKSDVHRHETDGPTRQPEPPPPGVLPEPEPRPRPLPELPRGWDLPIDPWQVIPPYWNEPAPYDPCPWQGNCCMPGGWGQMNDPAWLYGLMLGLQHSMGGADPFATMPQQTWDLPVDLLGGDFFTPDRNCWLPQYI